MQLNQSLGAVALTDLATFIFRKLKIQLLVVNLPKKISYLFITLLHNALHNDTPVVC